MTTGQTLEERLTDKLIRKYVNSPGVYQLKDPGRPLYFRYKSDRKTGTWFLVHYSKGRQIRRKIGGYPELKTAQIRDMLPEIHQEFALKHDAAQVRPCELQSVDDLLAWYLQRTATNSRISKTRRISIKSVIRRHVLAALSGFDVAELTRSVIDAEMVWPMQQRYSVAYVRTALSALKGACKQAAALELIRHNPLADVVLSDFIQVTIKAKPMAVALSELPQVAGQVATAQGIGRLLTMLMLSCGTRGGETRRAKWSEINWQTATWNIPSDHTKTGEGYAVPLTARLVGVLQRHRQAQQAAGYSGAYLCPNGSGQPISAVYAWESVQAVSGGRWAGHDLRKLARSMWLDLGVDYTVCELLLNHKFSKLDQAYIHQRAEGQKRAALELWHDTLAPWGVFGDVSDDPVTAIIQTAREG